MLATEQRLSRGEVPVLPGVAYADSPMTGELAFTFTGAAGPSLVGLVEGIRDDAALRELVGSQVRHRSHEVGRVVCARAAGRGEPVRTELADTVLDVAFARLFTQTLFSGTTPNAADQEHLVDAVLLPLLRPGT